MRAGKICYRQKSGIEIANSADCATFPVLTHSISNGAIRALFSEEMRIGCGPAAFAVASSFQEKRFSLAGLRKAAGAPDSGIDMEQTLTHLFLKALPAAVLTTLLGLTPSVFISALGDGVLVLGRKPALNRLNRGRRAAIAPRTACRGVRACLLFRFYRRIGAATARWVCVTVKLLGLPLVFYALATS